MVGQANITQGEGPLIAILAEMLKSALEWDSNSQVVIESENSLKIEPPSIDYPPTNPRPAKAA